MKIKFREACTVYPDGKTPQRYEAGATDEFADDYAHLLIKKGHAEDVEPALGATPSPETMPEEHHA